MLSTEDETFPRGGKKPNIKTNFKRPRKDENLFSVGNAMKTKKLKKDKNERQKSLSEESFYTNLNIQGTLTYNTLHEGMVILGCVRHITDFSVEVELPGLIFGRVNITRISDPLTKLLNQKLEQNDEDSDTMLKLMFHVGQILPVRVLRLEEKEKGIHVECSINPREIFDGKSHIWFKKGILIWASIQSVLDHGYEINVGVKNCRAFLPSKNVDDEKTLTIGQPFWCVIHKCESSNVATTLRTSSKAEHIRATKTEEVDNLDDLIPGVQVDFVVDKITSTGINGKFLNDYFGHITYTHLQHPLDELMNYKEGTLITAYVLFVEPATKVTHLSLRNLDPVPPYSLFIGDIVKAEVVSKGNNGIYLRCPPMERCFVTNKRMVASLPKKPNVDIHNAVSVKFPVGSKHFIRILDYNHLSRFYVCTVEQNMLKEKNFVSTDLKIGQLVNVTVDLIKAEGLAVHTGHIKGFVPNLYISNVEYSENIKRKFKEGLKINARVLHIDNDNVIFTLKPAQVESDQCLFYLDQAKRGDTYPGVVVQTKDVGALVLFYNNIRGWINKKQLGSGQVSDPDPRQYFFKGQVVNFWILGVKNEKVILSIKIPSELKTVESLKLHIGQRVRGIVGAVRKDSIDVINKRGNIVGKIPSNHLSTSVTLCSTFLKTYKVGDEINDLMCIDNTTKPCQLSRGEALAITRSSRIKIKKFLNLKKGNLIRCFYLSKTKTGIYVRPLLVDYAEKILIETKNIVGKGETIPSFRPQHRMVARILSINHDTKDIQLSVKLNKVFDSRVESTFEIFSQYIRDLLYLRKFGLENNWALCQYQPGQKVTCKVDQLGDEGGCLVILPNGVQGLVPPRLCPDTIQLGQTLKGVFLAENFEENFVEICLRADLMQRINVYQDGVIKTSHLQSILTEKLLIKNDYILGVLKPENCNRQFIYIPIHLHQNDFSGCQSYYEFSKIKLCICGQVESVLVGMSKKLFLHLDKQNARLNKKKMDKKVTERLESTTILPDNDVSRSKKKTTQTQNEKLKKRKEAKTNEERVETTDETQETYEDNEKRDIRSENTNKYAEENELSTNESVSSADENESDEDAYEVVEPMVEEQSRKRKNTHLVDSNNKSNKDNSKESFKELNNKLLPLLSGVSSFFNPETNVEIESSSDDEEVDIVVKKKKKLTPKERADQFRLEDERISKVEKELADSTRNPESAEQFDRLLLANPNSSELWTKYMSFHLAATEIDKARTVAKRALEAIDMTLLEERLNIWIALLNLENMLGSKESFEKTFEDALKYNDSLEIYLKAIQMLAESGKLTEMEEKIKKVRSKHKQDSKMWLEIAKVYYMLQKFPEARNLKEASLKSIQNKKTQLQLIIRFAIMEFKYGEEDQGAAIFETVLSNDPKKVTAWSVYVDQLVKKGQIEQARRVLERAVSVHLPVKSTKSLYLKFRMFEEQHGTPESVEAVKESAKMYFERVSKKLY